MKRASVEVLGDETFDVLVIGGGIYGLMTARDATLRELRIAQVERDDFGGATSRNSLKLMHGGIQYLQHLDFGRLRASAREQAFWQRAAALIYKAATALIRGADYSGARAIGVKAARHRLGGNAPDDITGACVRDRLSGAERMVRARVTLSCTGAGAADLAALHLPRQTKLPGFVRATNLVVDRQIGEHWIGVVSRKRSDAVLDRGVRMYFLTPWAGRTIVGTHETPEDYGPRDDTDVDAFLAEIAIACPAMELSRRDVLWAHQGLIPAGIDDARGVPKRQTRGTLIDHSDENLGGLLSLVGVKYTTASLIAERAVDRAAAQLDRPVPPSRAFLELLPVSDRVDPEISDHAGVQARITEAVEHEMAATLEDVMVRRTLWAETGAAASATWLAHSNAAGGLLLRVEDGALDRIRSGPLSMKFSGRLAMPAAPKSRQDHKSDAVKGNMTDTGFHRVNHARQR